ncbi:MAG TPA: 16S rRNA (uracil(1498)-N(3))-methyltransferase [Steroidobacteraceae bacterium]|nr:16S rRNA (uracil(1498)-N(3))-methyltransferase [Steroidobacteraceae bacterium]
MRLSRFFSAVPLAAHQELLLSEAAAAHAVRVLRLNVGAELVLFDGSGGEYPARILASDRQGVRVRLGALERTDRESPLQVTLLQGISRGDRMDFIVQKATELGVQRLVPLLCERSVVKLDAAQADRKRAHWQAIAISACEQCGRNRLPELEAVRKFDVACAALATQGLPRFMLEVGAGQGLLVASRAALTGADLRRAALLIGPEGGLADAERETARHHGFIGVSLGPRVLRTETAPLAALAVLQAAAGDLG